MGSEETSRQGETEYEIGRKTVAGAEGFEPSALGFGVLCQRSIVVGGGSYRTWAVA